MTSADVLPAPASRGDDFPDWFGPMLVKELRQGLKTRMFVVSFITLQVVFMLVLIYHVVIYTRNPGAFDASNLHQIFWMIVGAELLVGTPVRAMNSLLGERKANTLELIFMTGLSSWGIVLGKWISLMFQALLFVLAILPYGILRYFFGGVNLVEDLILLGCMLALCGLFSAAAIGTSGYPLPVRMVAYLGAAFFLLSGFIGVASFLVQSIMGGSSITFFSMSGAGAGGTIWIWVLIIYNAGLLLAACLQSGAQSIAPTAENHAMGDRILVVASWLPIPVLLLSSQAVFAAGQLIFFVVCASLATIIHLGMRAPIIGSHLEPWARFGRAGLPLAAWWLPGWPGATLFMILAIALGIGGSLWISEADPRAAVPGLEHYRWPVLLCGAVACGPLLWRVLFSRVKYGLVVTLILHVSSFLVVIFILALRMEIPGRWQPSPLFALFPPVGLWISTYHNPSPAEAVRWVTNGAAFFGIVVVALGLCAVPYWRALAAMFAKVRGRRSKPVAA